MSEHKGPSISHSGERIARSLYESRIKSIALILLCLLLLTTETHASQIDRQVRDLAVCALIAEVASTPFGEEIKQNYTCSDGSEFSFLTFVSSQEIKPLENRPNVEGVEYIENSYDPNYNCHSYALQQIQLELGVDLGITRNSWVEEGADSFSHTFGTEVVRADIPFGSFENREQFDNQIGEALAQTAGNFFIAHYYSDEGKLIHSGVIRKVEGNFREIGKFGPYELRESDIWYPAWEYQLNDPFEEKGETGYLVVYAFSGGNMPTITGNSYRPTHSGNRPSYPDARLNPTFIRAFQATE